MSESTFELGGSMDELLIELEVYEGILDKAVAKNSTELIPNAGEYHAASMMSKLFAVTKQKVCMVVGNFSGNVSDKANYQKALDNLLSIDNIEIRILLLDTPNLNSKAYQKLVEHRNKFNKKIVLKIAKPETLELLKSSFSSKSIVHFAVFDDNKFRLEISPTTYSAFGCFNDKIRATKLLNIFNTAFNTAA